MTRTVTGTLESETIGWEHGLSVGIFILLPVTFVALLSIISVVTSTTLPRSELRNDTPADGANDSILFNPSDPMHLVFATAAGDLGNTLGHFCGSDLAKAENIRVRLAYINDEKMGLVTDPVC